MAELAKKLHFKKDGVQQTAKAYSTIAEAGAEYITNKIDDINCYIPIGATTDSRMTIGRVTKNGSKAILNSGKPPYNEIEYRTPGTYTVTFPAGVTRARGTVAGAGGGGGGASTIVGSKGGNGGTGALITKNIIVTPLSTLLITVGKGGAGGAVASTGGTGGTGDTSSIGNLVSAQGGTGGTGAIYKANIVNEDGSDGTSYGNGGAGGTGGLSRLRPPSNRNGSTGADGWVIIEYGGDI